MEEIKEEPYEDIDLEAVENIARYLTEESRPLKDLSYSEIRKVVEEFVFFANLSIRNLNRLRSLNGDPPLFSQDSSPEKE